MQKEVTPLLSLLRLFCIKPWIWDVYGWSYMDSQPEIMQFPQLNTWYVVGITNWFLCLDICQSTAIL